MYFSNRFRSRPCFCKPFVLFVLGVFILCTGALCSCGQASGTAVSPVTDDPTTWVYLDGFQYKSEHQETLAFSCPTPNITSYTITYNDTVSKCLGYKMLDSERGVNLLVHNSNHKNYAPSQYPDYNDSTDTTHSCYSLMWLGDVSESSLKMASFYLELEGKGTACFKNEDDARKYLDTFFASYKTDFKR